MARTLIEKIESRFTLFVSIVILVVLFAPSALRTFFTDHTPPVTQFISAEATNSPIRAGDALIVNICRAKVRDDCPVTSSRTAIDQDGTNYVLGAATWEGGDPDAQCLTFAYPTESYMPPGQYRLDVHLSYQCPGVADAFEYDQPSIPFRIIEECRFRISSNGIIHGPDSPHWSQTSTERCFPTRAEAEAALP